MDEHSLELLEFGRVKASVAERASSPAAAAALATRHPLADPRARARESAILAEAIRREQEPERWCHVGPGLLSAHLNPAPSATAGLDGAALVEVLGWLVAADETRAAWRAAEMRERHPLLSARVAELPDLAELRELLDLSLDPDGRVRDDATPALRRARHALAHGERDLQHRLERWARGFGAEAYVTRHGDRFVVLVPAAGFPRRRGIVHDVSGSGHSLFVEPLEACEANNHLIEQRATAAEEERRVLLQLAGHVRAAAAEIEALESVLVELDSLRARAAWAVALGARAIDPQGERLRLVSARHPLLAVTRPADEVVPLDLELGAARLLLVSGPNMGGKTVLLKTVGLAVALAHAGFPVLAGEGSEIPPIDDILVDLGDEQSLDQGLSTFAAHVRSLAAMVSAASSRALLLCDELGAGTDPEEGAALGRALIERFAARGAWAVMTTHLGSLKRAAGEVPGVVNGSLEFDRDTLTPRYRFRAGIPGASHALAIAERLGLDAGVVARAREITPEETRAVERLLEDLESARRRIDEEEAKLSTARLEAEAALAEHRAQTENARRTLEDLRRRLTRESDTILARARELWQTVQREARRAEKSRAGAGEIRDRLGAAERELGELTGQMDEGLAQLGVKPEPPARLRPEEIVAGGRVFVTDLGVEADVEGSPDAEGRVRVRRGSLNIQTHVSRLERCRRGASPEVKESGRAGVWELPEEAPPLEVDVRGMDVEEALRTLDQGLDRGVLAGLTEIRIVHGIGRGILRSAVERHLREHSQVASQRPGVVGEGGRGVTLARLR